MKKIIATTILSLGFFALANAQIAKGTVALGGSIGYSQTTGKSEYNSGTSTFTSKSPKTSSFRFIPNVALFLSDRFAAGLGVGYSQSNGYGYNPNDGFTYKTKTTNFIVNPYVKYYVPLGEKVYFLANAGVSYSAGKTTYEGSDVDSKPSTTSVAISPGILFTPSEKIGIELGIGSLVSYTSTTTKSGPSKTTSNTFNFLNLASSGASVSMYFFFAK